MTKMPALMMAPIPNAVSCQGPNARCSSWASFAATSPSVDIHYPLIRHHDTVAWRLARANHLSWLNFGASFRQPIDRGFSHLAIFEVERCRYSEGRELGHACGWKIVA